MAQFHAYMPLNMNSLQQFKIFNNSHTVFLAFNPHEIKAELGNVVVDLKSLSSHPFTLSQHGPTGGEIGSIEVDVNGSVAYKFTGLSASIVTLSADVKAGNLHAALDLLLAGNDKITGSHGNDFLAGGAGNNTFVFAKPFGHDVITDFSVNDKIAISHTIFPNLDAVQDSAHVDAHGHVVIVVDGSDTITLNTVHHVSDLTAGEFLFT